MLGENQGPLLPSLDQLQVSQTDNCDRRTFLRAIGSTTFGAFLLSSTSNVTTAQPASSEHWPQPHFDATNNGYAPENTGLSPGADAEISESWRVGLERDLGVQPVLVNNQVMIPSGSAPDGGDEVGSVIVALDAEDGTEQWVFDEGGGWGCVASSEGVVYALDGGTVWALSTDDSSIVWETDTERTNQSAVVGNDTIYVGTRGESEFDTDSYTPATLRALRLEDGSERWSYEFPVYDDQEELNVSTPAVSGGTVYVGVGSLFAEAGGMYALSTANGEEGWSFDVNSNVNAPTVVDDSVYIGTGGGGGFTLYSVDAATGTEQWTYTAGAMWSPTVVDETVYVGYYGGFAALDSASGEVQWEFEADTDGTSAPAIVDSLMYATDGRQIKAFERANGELTWSFELDSPAASDPIVADQSVFVFSEDGALYAIGEETADPTATPTGTPTATPEPADESGGSGGGTPTPTDTPTPEESDSPTVSGVTRTASINQQRGTAGENQNGSSGSGGVSFWTGFGSSESTTEVGILGTVLGLTGIYAVYRQLSGGDD